MDVGGMVIGGVMCLLGAGLFVGGVRSSLTALSIYRTGNTTIRKLPQADGPVEFEGQAEATADDGAFEAPFSGEPALLCEIWMEQTSRHIDDEDSDQVIYTEGQKQTNATETVWGLAESDKIRWPFAVSKNGARAVVEPAGANLDITGHMGDVVHGTDEGETLSEEVRERLAALDGTDVTFDASLETWDAEEENTRYRESRLEPGEAVHVTGAEVDHLPDQWGSGIEATVGESSTDDRFLISRGTEPEVIRRRAIHLVSGVVIGLGLLGLGVFTVSQALSA